MANRSLIIGLLTAATLLALPALSLADVTVTSSIQGTTVEDGGSPASYFGIGTEDMQSFITDNHRYQLTTIIARVGNQNLTPTVFSELRADDPGLNLPVVGVGNVLTNFTLPDLTGPVSDRPFTPDTPVILEANTRYWFGIGTLSSQEAGSFDWAFTDPSSPITGPGTIPSRFAQTFDAGNNWIGFDESPFFLEVRGDIIGAVTAPEPSSFGLVALAGLPGLALFVRSRVTGRRTLKGVGRL